MLPRNFPSLLEACRLLRLGGQALFTPPRGNSRIGSGGQADEGSYILVATQQQYTITIIIIMMDDDDGDDIIIT